MSIAEALFDNLYWAFLAVIVLNLLQRKHGKRAEKKRFATLYLAIALFVIQLFSGLIMMQELPDLWLVPSVAFVIGVAAYFHKHTWPFRFRCAVSGERLDPNTFLYRDSNTLPEYDEEEPREEDSDDDD